MVKENGAPTAAEKGKSKLEDNKTSDTSKKSDDTKKGKDGKTLVNGNKGETKDGIELVAILMIPVG